MSGEKKLAAIKYSFIDSIQKIEKYNIYIIWKEWHGLVTINLILCAHYFFVNSM